MFFSLVARTLPKGFKVQRAVAQTIRLNHTNVFFLLLVNSIYYSDQDTYPTSVVWYYIFGQTKTDDFYFILINETKKQLASRFKSTNSPKAAITLCPKEASINSIMG